MNLVQVLERTHPVAGAIQSCMDDGSAPVARCRHASRSPRHWPPGPVHRVSTLPTRWAGRARARRSWEAVLLSGVWVSRDFEMEVREAIGLGRWATAGQRDAAAEEVRPNNSGAGE